MEYSIELPVEGQKLPPESFRSATRFALEIESKNRGELIEELGNHGPSRKPVLLLINSFLAIGTFVTIYIYIYAEA